MVLVMIEQRMAALLTRHTVLSDQSSTSHSNPGDQGDTESSDVDLSMEQILFETPSARKSLALHFILRSLIWTKKYESSKNNGYSKGALNHFQLLLIRLETVQVITLAEVSEYLVNISSSLPESCVDFLASTLSRMTVRTDDSRITIRSQRLLATLYEEVAPEVHALIPSSVRDNFTSSMVSSPSLVESTLLLWGHLLNDACRARLSQPVPIGELSYMLSVLERMIQDSRVSTFEPWSGILTNNCLAV